MTSYELVYEGGALVALPYAPMPTSPAIGVTMRAEWLPTSIHQDFIDLLQQRVAASPGAPMLREAG